VLALKVHKPSNLPAWADALQTMTTLAAKPFATRGATTIATVLSTLIVSLAPLSSARADNLNPILGGGLGAVAGAVIGQSIGGQNGAVIGAAVGGAAGVSIANEGSRQRNVQQPVYNRNPQVIVQPYPPPVYVQPQPVYVISPPYYGHRHYIREVRYEMHDGWRGGEHRGWGEQRFEGRHGDRHND
jgi:outer membrane lipoprotein SlyB